MAAKRVERLLDILSIAIIGLVRRDDRDLTTRQLAIFLTCYLIDQDHTVRGLAAKLEISKPAISRALDRLEKLDLALRKADPADRRSVLVGGTAKGAAFLRELRGIMTKAAKSARRRPPEAR